RASRMLAFGERPCETTTHASPGGADSAKLEIGAKSASLPPARSSAASRRAGPSDAPTPVVIQRRCEGRSPGKSSGIAIARPTSAATHPTRSARRATLDDLSTSLMSFQSLQDNPIVTTAVPCAAAFVVLVLAQRKRGLVRAYGTVFSVAIAADAWLDGAWTPVKLKPAWVIPVFFVILGDFRYFV